MRCKKHLTDLSSAVGVCASCLRERLFVIIAVQTQQDSRKSGGLQPPPPPPPPLSFPRSVSPYITRRKSDTATLQRFYSTPLVGPTGSVTVEVRKNKSRKSNGGRFSFLGLFRSKSEKLNFESDPVADPVDSSPSWFSTIIHGRRKKQVRTFTIDEGVSTQRRTWRNRDRGMSPARKSDEENDEHCYGGSSGYSSEQTPRRTPARPRRGGAGHNRNASGLAFCLSPLVRPSPNRHWNQKAMQQETAAAKEFRVPPKPHLSTAASFCKNRSRKLADFGRYNYNSNY